MPLFDGVTESDFVPEGFTEINSGVMGIRRSLRQRALIRYWLKLTIVLASILISHSA